MVRAAHPVNSLWKPQTSFRTKFGEPVSTKRYWKADGSCDASSEHPMEATGFLTYSISRVCDPKTLLEKDEEICQGQDAVL